MADAAHDNPRMPVSAISILVTPSLSSTAFAVRLQVTCISLTGTSLQLSIFNFQFSIRLVLPHIWGVKRRGFVWCRGKWGEGVWFQSVTSGVGERRNKTKRLHWLTFGLHWGDFVGLFCAGRFTLWWWMIRKKGRVGWWFPSGGVRPFFLFCFANLILSNYSIY